MWTVDTTTTVVGGAGATTCQSWQAPAVGSVVVHYAATDGGTGARGGHLILCWNAHNREVEIADTATEPVVSDLTFSATHDGLYCYLKADSGAGTWTVQAMRISAAKA